MTDHRLTEIQRLFETCPTVVLAEEDEELRASLASALASYGYRVVTVEDGLELLDYLRLVRLGRLKTPDVIVSDVDLRGCTGIEACRRAGRQFLAVPFILLAAPTEWDQTQVAGIDDAVEKPVDAQELRDAVALHIA